MKKRIILPIVLAVISFGLAVLGYFLLPDQVVIQLSLGSSGNSTVPKLLAILIPANLGIGGAVASLFSKEEGTPLGKGLLVSIVGIGLALLMIAVNFFTK